MTEVISVLYPFDEIFCLNLRLTIELKDGCMKILYFGILFLLVACQIPAQIVVDDVSTEAVVSQPEESLVSWSPSKDGNLHPTTQGELHITAGEKSLNLRHLNHDGQLIWSQDVLIPGVEDVPPDYSGKLYSLTSSFVAPDGSIMASAWHVWPKSGSTLMHISAQGELLHHQFVASPSAAILSDVIWDEQGMPFAAIFFQDGITLPGQKSIKGSYNNVAIVAFSKDFSQIVWSRIFHNFPTVRLVATPDNGLVLAGTFRHPVKMGSKVVAKRSDTIRGLVLRLDRKDGTLGWTKEFNFGLETGNTQLARIFGERLLIHFEGTGWHHGNVVLMDWQTGTQTEVIQTSPINYFVEDTRPNPDNLILADFETHKRRTSADGAHEFYFQKVSIKSFHQDGTTTLLNTMHLNPRYGFSRLNGEMVRGFVRDGTVTLDLPIEDERHPLSPMRITLGPSTPAEIVIDHTTPILKESSCDTKSITVPVRRALVSCVPEGDTTVIAQVKLLPEGKVVLDGSKSIGILDPQCAQEKLDQLAWCPGPQLAYEVLLQIAPDAQKQTPL